MKIVITVSQEDLEQAVENMVYYVNNHQNLHPDTEIDEKAIADIIKNHLENKIEDIINDPEKHLNSQEMTEVESCFKMPYEAYRKVMDRDIPYPA